MCRSTARCREGRFREDLFYRLDVIRMNVPPLRERPEDILFLFGHFTKRLAKHYGLNPPTFSENFLTPCWNMRGREMSASWRISASGSCWRVRNAP